MNFFGPKQEVALKRSGNFFTPPGNENTGTDEVWEIVESPPPDVDGDCDVNVRLRAAVVFQNIPSVEGLY